uniref:(northern house mosquito) hypothetical protein n=1 Tax=Culex pipiens TaxID=7175 RepID=A0A8D8ICU3_CULPI
MCRSFEVAILSAGVENQEPQLWNVDPYERRQDHQVEQRWRAAAAREPFQKSVKKQKPDSLVHAESEPSVNQDGWLCRTWSGSVSDVFCHVPERDAVDQQGMRDLRKRR